MLYLEDIEIQEIRPETVRKPQIRPFIPFSAVVDSCDIDKTYENFSNRI